MDNLLEDLALMIGSLEYKVEHLDSEVALFTAKVPFDECIVVKPGNENTFMYADDDTFGNLESATIKVLCRGNYIPLKDAVIKGIKTINRLGSITRREYKDVLLVGEGLYYHVYEIDVEFLYPCSKEVIH
jgi:hypothetical protein